MPVDFAVDSNVTAALAAAGGAIVIKFLERWINRKTESVHEGERLRAELRIEVDRYREENIRLSQERDDWRTRYWETQTLSDSDEIQIEALKTELHHGTDQIKNLTNTIQHLQDDIKRLQDDE